MSDQQSLDDTAAQGRTAETSAADHREQQINEQQHNNDEQDNKSSHKDKSVVARQKYINYYKTLRNAWCDQPDINITFHNLSYTVNIKYAPTIPNIITTTIQPALNLIRPLYYKLRHTDPSEQIQSTHQLKVLDQCSGLLQTGTMTLLLGPPGSGKSTLLRALSGHLPTANCLTGDIKYNGFTETELLQHGWRREKLVQCISEQDTHISTLTVEETCQIAVNHAVPDITILENDALTELHKQKVQIVLDMIGLDKAAKTYVGNALIRGLSGGEKKRLTISEMLMLNSRAFFGDVITNGLDSAIALNVMTALRDLCHETNATIMTCLDQSTPEIYNLFDNIALIRDGCIVYFGKRTEIQAYMESIGFVKPEHMDMADWLNDLLSTPDEFTASAIRRAENSENNHTDETQGDASSPDESHDLSTRSSSMNKNDNHNDDTNHDVQKHSTDNKKQKTPLTTDELVECWKNNDKYKQLIKNIELFDQYAHKQQDNSDKHENQRHSNDMQQGNKNEQNDANRLILPKINVKDKHHRVSEMNVRQYHNKYCYSGFHHMKLNLKRQLIITSRSRAMWLSRIFTALFVGLVLGGLFYQTPISYAQNRTGVILFAILAEAFNNLSELAAADEAKPVVYKQYDSSWYNSWTYTLGGAVMNAPVVIVESFVIGDAVYWLAGLDSNVGRYFFFMLMSILSSLFVAQLFRATSYFVTNSAVAQQVDGPLVGAMVVTAGFLIAETNFPHWLIWLYWLSPFAWVVRSISINQYADQIYNYPVSAANGIREGTSPLATAPFIRAGDQYLMQSDIQTSYAFVWGGFGYIIGVTVVLFILSDWAIANKRVVLGLGTKRSKALKKMNSDSENWEIKAGGGDNNDHAIDMPKTTRQKSQLEQMPFQRILLSWDEIKYTVPSDRGDKVLLNEISGYCRPGEITALMGSSGAGKTTLMDVISGRKTAGKIEGRILINGIDKDETSFNRITAYVEQFDLQMPWVSIRESFDFSARLRLPKSVTEEQRHAYVDEVIDILQLRDQCNRLVGSLSHGETKLTTIGVEMCSNPALLFLDEPTTGLDSKAAARVIEAVQAFASKRRTVLCTIHQPSTHLFVAFDRLLLMQTGGRTAYFGPLHKHIHNEMNSNEIKRSDKTHEFDDKRNGSAIVQFFKDNGSKAFDEQNDRNPADVMLEIVSRTDKYHETYEKSETAKQEQKYIEKYNSGTFDDSSDVQSAKHNNDNKQSNNNHNQQSKSNDYDKNYIHQSRYAQSFGTQLAAVIERQYVMYFRNSPFNLTRLAAQLVLGTFYGVLFFHIAQSDTTQLDVLNALAAIYLMCGFGGIVNAASALPNVFNDRPIFYRERSSDTYIPICYGISLFVVELLYVAAGSFIFTISIYYWTDLRGVAEWFWAAIFVQYLNALCFNSLGHFLAAACPNILIARQLQGLCFTFSLLFGGVFYPATQLPAGYKWIFDIDPIGHAVGTIMLNQFECTNANGVDCPTIVLTGESAGQAGQVTETIAEYVSDGLIGFYYGTSYYWNNVGWLFLIMITLRTLAIVSSQFIAHIKR